MVEGADGGEGGGADARSMTEAAWRSDAREDKGGKCLGKKAFLGERNREAGKGKQEMEGILRIGKETKSSRKLQKF